MTHNDDDLARRFSSVAFPRGEYVVTASTCIGIAERKPVMASGQEAQLLRIMIREYCQPELAAHSSFGSQKPVITKAMKHFSRSERTIKQALYEQPISLTASSRAAK